MTYEWPSYSVYLQNRGQGPRGRRTKRLPQNTFLCTGRMQCWHRSPASSVSRLASHHRPGPAHTGCSKVTCEEIFSSHFVHKIFLLREKVFHTCMSLHLYCSHREGSLSQPRNQDIELCYKGSLLNKFSVKVGILSQWGGRGSDPIPTFINHCF